MSDSEESTCKTVNGEEFKQINTVLRLKNSSNCKQKKEKEKKEVQWDEAIGLEERLWSEEESVIVK